MEETHTAGGMTQAGAIAGAPAAGGVPEEGPRARRVLLLNTFAFAVCFACWMLNGVLVAYLVDSNLFRWDEAQVGMLIAAPVLTGALGRLPVGLLTDRYGGRIVFAAIMLASALPMFLLSRAQGYGDFLLFSLGLGLSGASFAVGVAYTAVWFKKASQGTALGIFGMGNAGAAVTTFGAPQLLQILTHNGQDPERWRSLPQIYAGALVITALVFYFLTFPRRVSQEKRTSLAKRLAPLAVARVWRFGLYYFFVFGGFVALTQWLVLYYVNVYTMTVAAAGFMATLFNLPASLFRALGGWLSDKFGPRQVMYSVFGAGVVWCALLIVPRMDIYSPGSGIVATRAGAVTNVADDGIAIEGKTYSLRKRSGLARGAIQSEVNDAEMLIFPTFESWQEPVVRPGDHVAKRQLIAKGVTHIYFQANVLIFSVLVLLLGITMGIGMAGVYKYITDYFPEEIGVVGGLVGVIGALGGFFCPLIFGYLLKATGIWTTCWMLLLVLGLASLFCLHSVIRKMMMQQVPALMTPLEMGRATRPADASGYACTPRLRGPSSSTQ